VNYRLLLSVAPLFIAVSAHAWDWRGHALAANLGAKLMKDKGWSSYLGCESQVVGDAAGVPDLVFRDQSSGLTKGYEAEAPTHYFKIEEETVKPDLERMRSMKCSDAMSFLAKNYAPASPKDLPGSDDERLARQSKVGSAPWRALQFSNDAHRSIMGGKPEDAAYFLGVGAHYMADQSVPWHGMKDMHGEDSGHANIHIFLEHCMDSFLNPEDKRSAELISTIEQQAKGKRKELLKSLAGKNPSIPSLMISSLEESRPKADPILAIDDDKTLFTSGATPPKGTKKESKAAERVPGACEKFRGLLTERMATSAAFVSIYFDRSLPAGIKAPKACTPPTFADVAKNRARDYEWLACAPSAPTGTSPQGQGSSGNPVQ
jgi:hypothetical protein